MRWYVQLSYITKILICFIEALQIWLQRSKRILFQIFIVLVWICLCLFPIVPCWSQAGRGWPGSCFHLHTPAAHSRQSAPSPAQHKRPAHSQALASSAPQNIVTVFCVLCVCELSVSPPLPPAQPGPTQPCVPSLGCLQSCVSVSFCLKPRLPASLLPSSLKSLTCYWLQCLCCGSGFQPQLNTFP